MAEVAERTFLTQDEVAEMTGIRRGRAGRTAAQMQVTWFATKGIPAYLNEAGRAIVVRTALSGNAAPARRPWAPNALR